MFWQWSHNEYITGMWDFPGAEKKILQAVDEGSLSRDAHPMPRFGSLASSWLTKFLSWRDTCSQNVTFCLFCCFNVLLSLKACDLATLVRKIWFNRLTQSTDMWHCFHFPQFRQVISSGDRQWWPVVAQWDKDIAWLCGRNLTRLGHIAWVTRQSTESGHPFQCC